MTHSHSFRHSDTEQFHKHIMITPAFELSQDSDFLTLVVRVPYTRTSEFDIYIDGEDFKFYAKPYFLRCLSADECFMLNFLNIIKEQRRTFFG